MIKYPPVEFWKHFKQAKGAMSASEAIFMYNACLQVPDNGILVEAGTAYGKSALVSLMAWVNKGEKKFWLLEPEFKNQDWEKLGVISGSGTITEYKDYFYEDDFSSLPYNGVVLYRLKQVDFNGTFEYSNVIATDVQFIPTEN